MKKIVLITIVLVSFLVAPLAAQAPTPPKPLDVPFMKWMIGEWEGSMDGPRGKTQDSMAFRMGLNGQFMMMEAESVSQMGKYKGVGAVTVDPKTGHHVAYWIDNFRGRYEGKGKQEGNKSIMEWTGTMGKSTRITEKVSADKMKVTVKRPGPDGKMATFIGEFTRKKK